MAFTNMNMHITDRIEVSGPRPIGDDSWVLRLRIFDEYQDSVSIEIFADDPEKLKMVDPE